MTLAEATKFATQNGLHLTRQGMSSAALAHGFAILNERGKIEYKEEGVKDYVWYRLNKHPLFFRLEMDEYTLNTTSLLMLLVKQGIPYERFGAGYVISRAHKPKFNRIIKDYRKA